MAYLGSNQGSGLTCFVSATTVTRIKAVIITVVLSPYPRMLDNRRSWRANASQPTNKIMMSAATPVQSGDFWAKRPLRTSPINRICATIRGAAISNLPLRRRRSHIDRAGLSKQTAGNRQIRNVESDERVRSAPILDLPASRRRTRRAKRFACATSSVTMSTIVLPAKLFAISASARPPVPWSRPDVGSSSKRQRG